MKTNRITRAASHALAIVGVLAASCVLTPNASAFANFARRYGIGCEVCHTTWPQLTPVGYKFRVAGYRMPDEIGADAKFSNWGDVTAVRMTESFKVTEAAHSSAGAKTQATNGFSSSGVDIYPLVGAFSKYWSAGSEAGIGAGSTAGTTPSAVSVNSAWMRGTFPINADMFATVKAGLMANFEGYGAADRGVGVFSASAWKPTAKDSAHGTSFTYTGVTQSGEGLELGLNYKDTHASIQVTNGYNSFNKSSNQGEDNGLKDFGFYINQMFGEHALSAFVYSGKAGYAYAGNEATGFNQAQWIDNYQRAALYGNVKILGDKLALLAGVSEEKNHFQQANHDGSDSFNAWGWFTTVQSQVHEHLTIATTYDTGRASTRTPGNRVSAIDLNFSSPWENNKFDIGFQTKRTQNIGNSDVVANAMTASWSLFY